MTDIITSAAVAGPSDLKPPNSASSPTTHESLPVLKDPAHAAEDIAAGKPPYPPPAGVVYPPDCIVNPHKSYSAEQPVFEGLPPHSLYRPEFLPSDIDPRLDKASVWMGVERDTGRAIYFLPPTCKCCTKPSVAQHCDRGWPSCARCTVRGIPCESGEKWGMLKPKAKRRSNPGSEAKEAPFASNGPAESSTSVFRLPPPPSSPVGAANGGSKGKARAPPTPPGRSDGEGKTEIGKDADGDVEMAHSSPTKAAAETTADGDADGEGEGRSKRVRKKRRLSDADEIDPKRLTADGSIKKAKKPAPAPAPPPPPRALAGAVVPLTKDDEAYLARVEANSRKPPLKDMQGPCPVWAYTRQALCSAAEYLRDPVRTEGGSVEIGNGGIARGVILEGKARDTTIWETTTLPGTILTSIGKSRRWRSPNLLHRKDLYPGESQDVESTLPDPNIPKSPSRTDLRKAAMIAVAAKFTGKEEAMEQLVPRMKEEPAVEALLLAHRAGTPIAIAVAQDYSASPFKIPRPFIVLGWFWIMDAWIERASIFTPTEVAWRFRFEWCHFNDDQPQPWWPDKYQHKVYQSFRRDKVDYPPSLIMPDSTPSGSTSLLPDEWFLQHSKPNPTFRRYYCKECKMWSEVVYEDAIVCLNEACKVFWRNPHTGEFVDNASRVPPAWDYERLKPEALGLKLRPTRPYPNADLPREQMGRQRWRSWICDRCGMANERKHWRMADCEACGNISSGVGASRVYDEVSLRPPLRPVCTGPRQEDGLPSWPVDVSVQRSWTLYDDDIKVIQHDTSDFLAEGSRVFHALSTTSRGGHMIASKILRQLQIAEQGSVPLKRHTVTSPRRAAERCLSPFYTYLAGPEGATGLDAFPVSAPVKWTHCPSVCLDAIDLVNERAGRMSPGSRERFNSLLIAAFPPELATSHQPRITVEPYSEYALLLLGPDATLKFRPAHTRVKWGEITLQHGDVVLVRSREDAIDVGIKLDAFGFVCIARQCYQEQRIRLEEQMATSAPTSAIQSASNGNGSGIAAKVVQAEAVKSAPPVAKLPMAPMDEWYLGHTPVDPGQPIRALPSRRRGLNVPPQRPSSAAPTSGTNGEAAASADINGDEKPRVTTLSQSPPPSTLLAPPQLSKIQFERWLAGSNNDEGVVAPTALKPKAKRLPAKVASESPAPGSVAAAVKDDDTASVASKSSRGKKGPRASTGSTRGRGSGRGRGRGRASNAAKEGSRSVAGSEAGETVADVSMVAVGDEAPSL